MLGRRTKRYAIFVKQENDGFDRVKKKRLWRAKQESIKYKGGMYLIDTSQKTFSHRNKRFFYIEVQRNEQLKISKETQSEVDTKRAELDKAIQEEIKRTLEEEGEGFVYYEEQQRFMSTVSRDPEMINFFIGKKTIKQILATMMTTPSTLMLIIGVLGLLGGFGIGFVVRELMGGG